MKQPFKISAVSYLNTKPFLYGLFQSELDQVVDLSLDIPSECARKLIAGEVDLGLIPVAAIPQLETPHIISDFCIGTEGAVKTVCIYSACPIEEVTHLYLDYQSKTSVALTRYLITNYWKINPQFINALAGFEQKIGDKTAALIIGDRTIGLEGKYAYTYDLGEIWKKHTNLPFVFAAWVSNRQLPTSFLDKFTAALELGIQKRHQVAQLFQSSYLGFDVHQYYHRYIDYELTTEKRQALKLFLEYIAPKREVLVSK
ncbi:menaquinone biosynthetic enzyme MqnA/MqnD family protein [Aureispira anguillae]|uniref:Chorismate dehydratase n=1 Tax=Aureispira anguillae TaxID=2864201 RepID=A0A916DPN3_9BACT|nr:menaquinone biosynthesis protein [Aureispira anguillae]BDS10236.1 menaquinone biosynthesis protein [Aureispira anguillae]